MTISFDEYDIRLYYGRSGLETLFPAWRELYDRATETHFFQAPEWYASYLDTLASDPEQVIFVSIMRQGRLAAVLPFTIISHRMGGVGVTILEVPWHPHLKYRDILLDDAPGHLWQLVMAHKQLKKQLKWDMIKMKAVYAHSHAMRTLTSQPEVAFFAPQLNRCAKIQLIPVAEMMKKFSKKTKKRLRNIHNRLNKLSDIRYTSATSPTDLKMAFKHFLDVEASGWKGKQGSAIKQNEGPKRFYQAVYDAFSATQSCEINGLWEGQHPIAMEFVVLGSEGAYTVKTGYDESFAKYSPGHCLLEYMIDRYHNHPAMTHINLMTDRSYLDYMKPDKFMVHDFYVFNRTLGGGLLHFLIRLRYLVREVYKNQFEPALQTSSTFARLMKFFKGFNS